MIGYLKAQLLLSFFVSRETNTYFMVKVIIFKRMESATSL